MDPGGGVLFCFRKKELTSINMGYRMAYIYMVRCKDDSIYTGIAKDLGQRMREHYYKKKPGAKYTKSRQIQSLEMVWETDSWSHAAKLEIRIKRLTKRKKEELIRDPGNVQTFFPGELEEISYEPRPDFRLTDFLERSDQ
jgi:putative endonuclease